MRCVFMVVTVWRAVLASMGSYSPLCLRLGSLAEMLCKDAACCVEKHSGWRNSIAAHEMQWSSLSFAAHFIMILQVDLTAV